MGVVLEGLNLLVVSLHLTGTNKYGVPEAKFDEERRRQLMSISEGFEKEVGMGYAKMNKVVMGDYNFRTEVKSAPEEKERGGSDWSTVNDEVMSGEQHRVDKVFFGFDRLQRWMVKRGAWERSKVRRRPWAPRFCDVITHFVSFAAVQSRGFRRPYV